MAAATSARRRRSHVQPIELARGRVLPLGRRTLLMAVVNVTGDSFYAGSRTPRPAEAIERALALAAEGADVIDVGGESTRPGAEEVPAAEEMERVLPVIEGIRKASPVAVSIDTRKAVVARAAVAAGADIVNDVSGLAADPDMAAEVARSGAIAIVMHMRGTPRTMQEEARYEDVLLQVKAELGARLAAAARAGISPGRTWIDPGIGFAKTARHNLEILNRLDELAVFERAVLVGTSRKSFIGRILGQSDPAARLEGSLAASAAAVLRGADVLRVHDVAATRRVTEVVEAILEPERLEG